MRRSPSRLRHKNVNTCAPRTDRPTDQPIDATHTRYATHMYISFLSRTRVKNSAGFLYIMFFMHIMHARTDVLIFCVHSLLLGGRVGGVELVRLVVFFVVHKNHITTSITTEVSHQVSNDDNNKNNNKGMKPLQELSCMSRPPLKQQTTTTIAMVLTVFFVLTRRVPITCTFCGHNNRASAGAGWIACFHYIF